MDKTTPNNHRFRCHTCRQEFAHYAPIERHVDEEHGGGRIEAILPTRSERVR